MTHSTAAERMLIAEVHGLAGRASELQRLLTDLADAARLEPGCLMFRALRGDEAGEFVLLSLWRDESMLRAHYGREAYQRYRAAVGELLARPSDVTMHHVIETVHPIDPEPPDPARLG